MAFINGQSVAQKTVNKNNAGIYRSVVSLSTVLADLLINGPKYGTLTVPATPPEAVTEVTARNDAIAAYWATQKAMAASLMQRPANHPIFTNILNRMCDGILIFKTTVTGSQLHAGATEANLLRAMIVGADLFTTIQTGTVTVGPEQILTPTDLETGYDVYWADSGLGGYDRAVRSTWGAFVPDAAHTTYYNQASWQDRVNHIQLVGDN